MPTKVEVPASFLKELRKLAKKYPAILKQFEQLSQQLIADERPGDKIPGIGYEVYKVRLPNSSARRGKSGGFRVIYYVKLQDRVILVAVYSKAEQSDIAPQRIQQVIADLASDEDPKKTDEQ